MNRATGLLTYQVNHVLCRPYKIFLDGNTRLSKIPRYIIKPIMIGTPLGELVEIRLHILDQV